MGRLRLSKKAEILCFCLRRRRQRRQKPEVRILGPDLQRKISFFSALGSLANYEMLLGIVNEGICIYLYIQNRTHCRPIFTVQGLLHLTHIL